jgi:crossover junction endodeoxyribonuclease RuvC
MRYCGIDPGVSGAIAAMEGDRLLEIFDIPTLDDGPKGRRTINAPIFASIIKTCEPDIVFLEKVGVRPGEGAVGAFSFGRGVGVIEGVCACAGVRIVLLTPQMWKKQVGIATGSAKDASRSMAIRRWPNAAAFFKRVKDDGRAEAALIGLAGMARELIGD